MQGLCVVLLCMLGVAWAMETVPLGFVSDFLNKFPRGAVLGLCTDELIALDLLRVGPRRATTPPPTKRAEVATLLQRYLSTRSKRAANLTPEERNLIRICKPIVTLQQP